jgi:hypothetical protein
MSINRYNGVLTPKFTLSVLLFIDDTFIVAFQLVDFYDSQRLVARGPESDI